MELSSYANIKRLPGHVCQPGKKSTKLAAHNQSNWFKSSRCDPCCPFEFLFPSCQLRQASSALNTRGRKV